MKFKCLQTIFVLFICATCAAAQGIKRIDPLSTRSLSLATLVAGTPLAVATGFIVEFQAKPYLMTNWHVVTGRDPATGKIEDANGQVPDQIAVWHHGKALGTWHRRSESLFGTNGKPNWIEHPKGQNVDVIALPLKSIDSDIKLYPLDLSLANTDMIPVVAMPVSIIGFPFGLSGPGKFPIWKTGHIATDPELDFDNSPIFLIDATTRPGMSGSMVVLRLTGGYQTKSGGSVLAGSGIATRFLGVYSAQQRQSEIGKVWKPEVIIEILGRAK